MKLCDDGWLTVNYRRALSTKYSPQMMPWMVIEFNICAPLGKSDHLYIISELNLQNETSISLEDSVVKLWGKVTCDELLEASEIVDWSWSRHGMSSEEMWAELSTKLGIIDDTVVPSAPRKPTKPWANSSLKRNWRAKDRAWADFDIIKTHDALSAALMAEEKYKNCELKARAGYEKRVTRMLKNNCKPFYSYLRSKRILKTCVGSLLKRDGSTTKTNEEAADVKRLKGRPNPNLTLT